MDNMGFVLDYLARWGHFLFGIAWIGLLYYFNFVQGEYFKESDASRARRCVLQTGSARDVVLPLGSCVHVPDGRVHAGVSRTRAGRSTSPSVPRLAR